MYYQFSNADLRSVVQESKSSIGAEVNWGVRFRDLKDSHHFLSNLSKEVCLRLQGCAVQGRTFTLKIKKRRKDAQEAVKFMACGDCENLSHCYDVKEIRGIGLEVSKLETVDSSKQGLGKHSLKSWFQSAKASSEEQLSSYPVDDGARMHAVDNHRSTGATSANQVSAPPPLCHLDIGVIESLPSEIFTELNGIYAGKLADFVAKNKRDLSASTSHERVDGEKNGNEKHLFNHMRLQDDKVSEPKHTAVEKQVSPSSGGRSCDAVVLTSELGNTNIMPASLSQVDPSVLQELPQELRVCLLEQLPAHRRTDFASTTAVDPLEEVPGESTSIGDNNLSRSNDPAYIATTSGLEILHSGLTSSNLANA